jgi:hypothetical protein
MGRGLTCTAGCVAGYSTVPPSRSVSISIHCFFPPPALNPTLPRCSGPCAPLPFQLNFSTSLLSNI